METSLEQSMSFGSADFAERLEAGQMAAKSGDGADISFMDAEENDRLEDTLTDCPAGISKTPEATQIDDEDDEDEDKDEAMKTELKSKFSTLNSMAYRLKDLWAIKNKAGEVRAGDNKSHYEMMESMHGAIDEQDDGDQKLYNIHVFNHKQQ